MNDMNDIDTLIGPALRERMRSEQPDLEHLAGRSLRAGLRLRRRRRVATAAGGTAAVAVVGVGVAVSQGGSGTTARDPQVADSTTAAPSATVTADPSDAADLPTGAPAATLPVTVDAAGWKCDSFPIDEKMFCTKGRLGISVVVRDEASYADWKGNPDKEGSSLWVSPVHGNYFVSVQGGSLVLSDADLAAFIDGLQFADSWQRP